MRKARLENWLQGLLPGGPYAMWVCYAPLGVNGKFSSLHSLCTGVTDNPKCTAVVNQTQILSYIQIFYSLFWYSDHIYCQSKDTQCIFHLPYRVPYYLQVDMQGSSVTPSWSLESFPIKPGVLRNRRGFWEVQPLVGEVRVERGCWQLCWIWIVFKKVLIPNSKWGKWHFYECEGIKCFSLHPELSTESRAEVGTCFFLRRLLISTLLCVVGIGTMQPRESWSSKHRR